MLLRITFTFAVLAAQSVLAEDTLPPSTKSFSFENDLFVPNGRQGDRWYTQGIRISRIYDVQERPSKPPRLETKSTASTSTPQHTPFKPYFSFLTDLWCPEDTSKTRCTHRGWSIGQFMFSPADIQQAPDPEDRPWGGWLYIGSTAQKVIDEQHQRVLEVDVGIIGTRSGSRWIQKEWHELINSREPLWNNNLKNELGVFVDYHHRDRHRSFLHEQMKISDFVFHYGANAGNVTTSAYGGGTLRWGENITGFGVQVARPTNHENSMSLTSMRRHDTTTPERQKLVQEWWLFALAELRLVAFNVFLDGNMFRSDSPSVDRKPAVADFGLGGHVRLRGDHKITYALIKRTKEFNAPSHVEHDDQFFGIITYSHDLQ